MQVQPTVGGRASLGAVQGLGVSDALRLALSAVQVPWLVDELEELRGPYEERLLRLRSEADASDDPRASDAVRGAEYDLRLLRLMRAQVAVGQPEPILFVGPSAMVAEIVRGTMRNVAEALGELAAARLSYEEGAEAQLRTTAAAAHAWVETFLACREVEAFTFDDALSHGPS